MADLTTDNLSSTLSPILDNYLVYQLDGQPTHYLYSLREDGNESLHVLRLLLGYSDGSNIYSQDVTPATLKTLQDELVKIELHLDTIDGANADDDGNQLEQVGLDDVISRLDAAQATLESIDGHVQTLNQTIVQANPAAFDATGLQEQIGMLNSSVLLVATLLAVMIGVFLGRVLLDHINGPASFGSVGGGD